jgi:hypothetical protein
MDMVMFTGHVTEAELFSIMCAVERSDFLFRPGALVCANPLSAEFSIQGPIPRLWLVGWDSEPKRRIATEAVAYLDVRRSRYVPEYADLAGHCNSGETDALLYAVTRSAEINQELLPKPCFRWANKIAKQFDAALLVAHSGTFMAFAIPRDEGAEAGLQDRKNAAKALILLSKPEFGGDARGDVAHHRQLRIDNWRFLSASDFCSHDPWIQGTPRIGHSCGIKLILHRKTEFFRSQQPAGLVVEKAQTDKLKSECLAADFHCASSPDDCEKASS